MKKAEYLGQVKLSGKGPLPLKMFVVRGWRKISPASTEREPMKEMRVQALDGIAAAKTYARCNQIPESFWNDGSASPLIVIRVS